MKKQLLLLLPAVLLTACGSSRKATVSGTVDAGAAGKTIYIERLLPSGNTLADSVRTDKKGAFTVKLPVAGVAPEFYTLHIGTDGRVPLLLAGGERVTLDIVDSTASAYSVSGSEGSAQVREVNDLMRSADGLYRVIANTEYASEKAWQEDVMAYGEAQVAQKRAVVKFIVANPASLASVIPFHNLTPDGRGIFNEPEDIVYFRMVSDSINARYPGTPFARSMASELAELDRLESTAAMIEQQLDSGVEEGLVDLQMPDPLGKTRRLSDLKGKVVLLSFTASSPAALKVLNRELVDVYKKYAPQGFEVYQVSLDISRADWLNTVSEQRLPWISVCDLKGMDSKAVRLYNVKTVPYNFLIDRQGEVVRRNVKPADLPAAISGLL